MTDGAVGALGSFFFCLGLILPTALLLARHSAEVQRDRAKPLLGREQLPSWVSIATAGLMGVLFLTGTGSAIFAGGASSAPISPRLEEEAEAASRGQGAQELSAAQEQVANAKQIAAAPLGRRNSARRRLANARRELQRVQGRLVAAKSSQRSFERRLVAFEAKECDPNYSGCLDPYSPDYDCAGGSGDGPDYTGTVTVLGEDHYGLDADGDGTGCEPY